MASADEIAEREDQLLELVCGRLEGRGGGRWAGAGAGLQGGLPHSQRSGLGRGVAAVEAAWFPPAFRTVRAGVGIGWRQRPQELTGRRVVAERLRATEPDWV